jgi:hypothetical protein
MGADPRRPCPFDDGELANIQTDSTDYGKQIRKSKFEIRNPKVAHGSFLARS